MALLPRRARISPRRRRRRQEPARAARAACTETFTDDRVRRRRARRMKQVEVEVYADDVNAWVVRTPQRRFPALVIQGDSFSIIVSGARSALDAVRRGEPAL